MPLPRNTKDSGSGRLLAISHSFFRAINRNVYVELANRGLSLSLVAPVQLYGKPSEPRRAADPAIDFLKLNGSNPRHYRFQGLGAVLKARRPTALILDCDPASVLAVELGVWCKFNGAALFCQSNENLDFSLASQFSRGGWSSLPSALAKLSLTGVSRHLAHTVFTINDDGTEIFQKYGFRDVIKIPLGFDPSIFYPDEIARKHVRARHGIEDDEIVFAYFGRLVRQKGVDMVVEALGGLRREVRNKYRWRLFLDRFEMDNDYGRYVMERINQNEIGDRVILFDADHLEIANYMNASDVALLASISTPLWKEQYGRVVPEAMACGNLVIVSDSGAPKELLGDAGIVFREGDWPALQQVMQKILASPEKYKDKRGQAVVRARNFLTLQIQADKIQAALSQLS